jgi:ankyrin repeat protein
MKPKLLTVALCLLVFLGGRVQPAENTSLNSEFYTAIRVDDLPRVRTLAATRGAANMADTQGETPLMYAAEAGSVDAIKLLVAAGADVNQQSASGATALMLAATDLAKTRALLDAGADPNRTSKGGKTALLLAAMSDPSIETVRLLIAKGASVKAVDEGKTTALLAAAQGNDTQTIRLMIDAGLDVNAANVVGLTPLMFGAGIYANVPATSMLLAKKAQVNVVTADSLDALDTAKAGPVQDGRMTPLLLTTTFGPPSLAKRLLDLGANVNAKDVRGMTPLMLAVATDRQDSAMIRLLLDRGADPAAKSVAGETAADWARKIGRQPALQLLNVKSEARATATPSASPLSAGDSVQRSVSLMEKASAAFYQGGGCVSCHHQAMTDLIAGEARARGLRVDDAADRERVRVTESYYARRALYERDDPPGAPEQTAYSLLGLSAMGHPADRLTDAMVANVVAFQGADGGWHGGGLARPPAEEGDVFKTALAVRALRLYGSPGRRADIDRRVGLALRWMSAVTPVSLEDRNMQLLGLVWAGADASRVRGLAQSILSTQQPDGGWRQADGLASDAYATGESLYALATAGVAVGDRAYQRGLMFLLGTQAADGSWRVLSRAPKIQVYFNGGFPYAGNQWISAWATGWSALAIAQAVPRAPVK